MSRDVIFEEQKAWDWNEVQQPGMPANQEMFIVWENRLAMENENHDHGNQSHQSKQVGTIQGKILHQT